MEAVQGSPPSRIRHGLSWVWRRILKIPANVALYEHRAEDLEYCSMELEVLPIKNDGLG